MQQTLILKQTINDLEQQLEPKNEMVFKMIRTELHD